VGFAVLDLFAASQERKVFMQKLSFKVPMGLIAAAIAGVMFTGSAAQANTVLVPAVSLSSLLTTGASITVGDKTFSNFTYSATGNMPTAANVNVIGIRSDIGNLGIEFQGAFQDLPDANNAASDALINYRVTVNDPNFRITDAHLDSNIASISAGGSGTITEDFTALIPTTPPLLSFNTNFDFTTVGGTRKISDTYIFGAGYTSIAVRKDILLTAGTGGNVNLSSVDQTFSQTPVVPLPAAAWAGLSMLGGLGFFGAVRRRRIG